MRLLSAYQTHGQQLDLNIYIYYLKEYALKE